MAVAVVVKLCSPWRAYCSGDNVGFLGGAAYLRSPPKTEEYIPRSQHKLATGSPGLCLVPSGARRESNLS